jgi:hypothetical protein
MTQDAHAEGDLEEARGSVARFVEKAAAQVSSLGDAYISQSEAYSLAGWGSEVCLRRGARWRRWRSSGTR